jgi:hypothetical protein
VGVSFLSLGEISLLWDSSLIRLHFSACLCFPHTLILCAFRFSFPGLFFHPLGISTMSCRCNLQFTLHNLNGWFRGTFPHHIFSWTFSLCMGQLTQSLLLNHLYDLRFNGHLVSFMSLVCWQVNSLCLQA